jgi:hypothetical protein
MSGVGLALALSQNRRLLRGVNQRQVNDKDGQQFCLSGVKAAFEDVQAGNGAGVNAQCLAAQMR